MTLKKYTKYIKAISKSGKVYNGKIYIEDIPYILESEHERIVGELKEKIEILTHNINQLIDQKS
jgi:hypothetical protein